MAADLRHRPFFRAGGDVRHEVSVPTRRPAAVVACWWAWGSFSGPCRPSPSGAVVGGGVPRAPHAAARAAESSAVAEIAWLQKATTVNTRPFARKPDTWASSVRTAGAAGAVVGGRPRAALANERGLLHGSILIGDGGASPPRAGTKVTVLCQRAAHNAPRQAAHNAPPEAQLARARRCRMAMLCVLLAHNRVMPISFILFSSPPPRFFIIKATDVFDELRDLPIEITNSTDCDAG